MLIKLNGESFDGTTKLLKSRSNIILGVVPDGGEIIESVSVGIKIWSGLVDLPTGIVYEHNQYDDSISVVSSDIKYDLKDFIDDAFIKHNSEYGDDNSMWVFVDVEIVHDGGTYTDSITAMALQGYVNFFDDQDRKFKQLEIPSDTVFIGSGRTYDIPILNFYPLYNDNTNFDTTQQFKSFKITYSDGTIYEQDLDNSYNDNPHSGDIFKDVYSLSLPIGVKSCRVQTFWDIGSGGQIMNDFRVEEVNCSKFKNLILGFRDKNGTYQYIFMNGKHEIKNTIDYVEFDSNNVVDIDGAWDTNKSQLGRKVINGSTDITMSTNYVNEDYYSTLRQMLLSDYVFILDDNDAPTTVSYTQHLIDSGYTFHPSFDTSVTDRIYTKNFNYVYEKIPVYPIDKTITKKTRLQDKMISYKLKFKYGNKMINNTL